MSALDPVESFADRGRLASLWDLETLTLAARYRLMLIRLAGVG
jgi:hypothetical protein